MLCECRLERIPVTVTELTQFGLYPLKWFTDHIIDRTLH